jgi:hypothetical protein
MQDHLLLSAKRLVFELTCGEIQKRLAAAGVSMLVLKGPHVAAALYDDPAGRDYSDLDILVRPEHYFSAAGILLKSGFKLFSVNRRRLASERADYQLLLRSPRGMAVELHCALADRGQFRSDVEGFFSRSEGFSFGELKCRGLSTEDLLLHLCLHFGKRHFMTGEPKHLHDIALLLKKKSIAWPAFLDRVKVAGCRIVTYYCLQAAVAQYRAVVPGEMMRELRPGRLRCRLLKKYLNPALFPIYRFSNELPGARDRWVNLLLLDRISTMASASIRFSVRESMDLLLRAGWVRRIWLMRHPLAEWVKKLV